MTETAQLAEVDQFQAELEQYVQSRLREGGDPYEIYLHAAAQAMGAWRLAKLLNLPGQLGYQKLHAALGDKAIHFQQRERG